MPHYDMHRPGVPIECLPVPTFYWNILENCSQKNWSMMVPTRPICQVNFDETKGPTSKGLQFLKIKYSYGNCEIVFFNPKNRWPSRSRPAFDKFQRPSQCLLRAVGFYKPPDGYINAFQLHFFPKKCPFHGVTFTSIVVERKRTWLAACRLTTIVDVFSHSTVHVHAGFAAVKQFQNSKI